MRKLLPLLLTIFIAGCTTWKFSGEVDLSYVPRRIDDVKRYSELKAEVSAELEQDIGFYVHGMGAAYGGIDIYNLRDGLHPHRVESEIQLGWRIVDGIDIYARHMSNHPISSEEQIIHKDGVTYKINEYDAIEEIGVKIKF